MRDYTLALLVVRMTPVTNILLSKGSEVIYFEVIDPFAYSEVSSGRSGLIGGSGCYFELNAWSNDGTSTQVCLLKWELMAAFQKVLSLFSAIYNK